MFQAKVVEVRVIVPGWVSEEEVRRVVEEAIERLSHRIPAEELRKILGVKRTTWEIEVPEGLEEKILESRRKRVQA